MYEGYLSLGGAEVVSTTRALGYTQSGDCPIFWLDDDACEPLADALGQVEYDRSNISAAPWYDGDIAELSSRFLGASMVSVSGLDDSTRTAATVERAGDGGDVVGYRHASKEIRVRAMLTADGSDALSYGLEWLSQTLEPGSCSMHGDACDKVSLEFFSTCPPERGSTSEVGEWETIRTNATTAPRAGAGWSFTSSLGTTTGAVENRTQGPAYVATWPTGGNDAAAAVLSSRAAVLSGDVVPVSIDVAASSGLQVVVTARFLNSSLAAIGTPITLRTGSVASSKDAPTRVSGTVTVPSGAAHMLISVVPATAQGIPNGAWLLLGRYMIGSGAYFDGTSIPATQTERTVWEGAANASRSLYQTRRPAGDPYTDAEYQALQVDPLRRYVHDVMCISGPLVERRMKSQDGRHVGMIVEFTLFAETPRVYSKPQPIPLGISIPFVYQDVPHNIVTRPSAERTEGTVEVGRNYITNPSFETNTTGWNWQGPPTTYFNFTSGRTNELAASGSWSMRGVVTGKAGSPAGDEGGNIYLFGPFIPLTDLPVRSRPSFTAWAAAFVYSGVSPTTLITGIQAIVEWSGTNGAGSAVIAQTTLVGRGDLSGMVFSRDSVEVPVVPGWTVTSLRLIISYNVRLRSSATAGQNSEIRMYADAIAVTVP